MLVLVDEANVTGTFREFNRRVGWASLRGFVFNSFPKQQDRDDVFAMFVGRPPANNEQFSRFREQKDKFISFLYNEEFRVFVREGVLINSLYNKSQPISYKANVDIMMAVEAFCLLEEINTNHIVVMTGDNDFGYLTARLLGKGYRVTVAAIGEKVGWQLVENCSDILLLDEFLNRSAAYNLDRPTVMTNMSGSRNQDIMTKKSVDRSLALW
jgi:NYN domain-containing protein